MEFFLLMILIDVSYVGYEWNISRALVNVAQGRLFFNLLNGKVPESFDLFDKSQDWKMNCIHLTEKRRKEVNEKEKKEKMGEEERMESLTASQVTTNKPFVNDIETNGAQSQTSEQINDNGSDNLVPVP